MLSLPAVRTLRPGLHLLETEVEDFDVRAAVLVGTERAVVWDTLAHPLQMQGVLGMVAASAPLPVVVVYSHADWDHAWGTCALGDVEDVVAHAWAERRFRSDVPEELDARRAREPGAWDGVRLVPPTVLFERTHTLDLGDVTLELHALPGHTPDSIVGLVPEWGVLLAGDTVETPLPVVNDGSAVMRWADRAVGVIRLLPRDPPAEPGAGGSGERPRGRTACGGRSLYRRILKKTMAPSSANPSAAAMIASRSQTSSSFAFGARTA
ncbi:MAG: MBL fold metallo-hydrolase [Gemmatimonadetes bacterium]|nr:MBL fold metallo-hydrolase [Gemmatimonadota bacterium]